MAQSRGTQPLWLTDVSLPSFPALDEIRDVDVIVVGGGLSGLTSALLLQRAGYRTAIVEQHRVGLGETSRTSAHLTLFPDATYKRIATDFGNDGASAVASSKTAALQLIEDFSREVACDFARVPGYLYTENDSERPALQDEAEAARAAGVEVRAIESAPLPFPTAFALEFPQQAQFHPMKYIAGLIRLYAEAGGQISEGRHVTMIEEQSSSCRVRTGRATSRCKFVVSTTDAPITGGTLLDTKLRANRSYVLAARVAATSLPTGLFWDTNDPYHFTRMAMTSAGPVVIIGGEDHRVGTDGEVESSARLEEYARTRWPIDEIMHRWSGQIMEPVDGLPYIGARSEGSRIFLATGYAGNGLTFGTVAAQLIADLIADRANPYTELYSPNRALGARQWAKYAAQNLPAAWTLVADTLPLPLGVSIEDVKPGEGKIVRVNGQKVAAARDASGTLHLVSPTCTHMGCDVAWNTLEQTWDCPCHGSRYDVDGRVIHGPATAALEPVGEEMSFGNRRKR